MREQIEKLVDEELDRANAKFPQFASRHEGWAVLREEVLKAKEEMDIVNALSGEDRMFSAIMGKWQRTSDQDFNIGIYKHTILAITELVQVAAMCKKYQNLKHES